MNQQSILANGSVTNEVRFTKENFLAGKPFRYKVATSANIYRYDPGLNRIYYKTATTEYHAYIENIYEQSFHAFVWTFNQRVSIHWRFDELIAVSDTDSKNFLQP